MLDSIESCFSPFQTFDIFYFSRKHGRWRIILVPISSAVSSLMLERWQVVVWMWPCSPIAVFISLKCPAQKAQRERKWSKRKHEKDQVLLSSQPSLCNQEYFNESFKKFLIFSFYEVPRLHVLLSAFFKHLQVNMSVPLVLLARHSCENIQSNIYEARHHTVGATANFQLKYLILKANTKGASCSWSRNNVLSFHHAVLCWKSLVHPLADSAISVWLAVGDPWASKIHWSSANICQAWRPMSRTTSAQHISTNLFMNAAFVVDMMENVCCHASVLARRRPPTLPLLISYHCFNAVCRGKGIRWPAGLWHLVSTISPRRRWDLWNGSHTRTWVLLKPPVKATWP